MDFGGETKEQAAINLIIGDGDKSRGQRESLLSTEIKRIGVVNVDHDTYRHCTAIVTCAEFENTVDDDDNGLLEEEPLSKNLDKDNEEGEGEGEEEKEKKGKTLKPRKIILKTENADKNYRKPYKSYGDKEKNEGEGQLPAGVSSLDKTEKIIMENGCKKNITKIEKVVEDGSKQIETIKEVVDE